jgi:exonuclease, DNA polymerase III, epsilon subunit family
MTADKIWLAELDFSQINREKEKKTVSQKYQIVMPEKYIEVEQAAILDYLDKPKDVPELLKGKTYVAFDLETTGLDVNSVMIVQLGAAKISDGKVVETFQTLVNPVCHIPEDATAVHGITDDMVLSAPEFYEVLPDFYKFTRGATLVGQNIFGYDMPILNRFAKLYGYEFDNPIMDTLIMAKSKIRLPRYNLDMLCKHFDVSLSNAHKADCDALATAKCFIKLASIL